MAKLSKRTCDLCGCEIKKGEPRGMLRVPLDPERQPPAHRVENHDGHLMGFFRMSFGEQPDAGNEYDVCRGCCEGLIRLADTHKRSLRAALQED